MALRWPYVAVILSGGAVDALKATHHPLLNVLTFDRLEAAHGRRFRATVPSHDATSLTLLLVSVGAGDYPQVTDYGRKACRKAVQQLGVEPIRRYTRRV